MNRLDYITTTPVSERKLVEDAIVCKDGTTLSVQASDGHYCSPRNNRGPWTAVEVGFPSVKPPDSWQQYAEEWTRKQDWFSFVIPFLGKKIAISRYVDNSTGTVYAWIPVQLVRDFIYIHGGE